jgi:DNA-directed RNA polymerase subunit alpha
MKAINNPKTTSVESNGKNSAIFTIEPLYQGYGNTLGNSLRRVLLSSLSGAAITAFKIEGVGYEYTTIPGVKEDVVEIMINLKNLVFKSHSDKAVELKLSAKGAGTVTAKNITPNSEVEVVDEDAFICTIDDPKAKVEMTLTVNTGVGYQAIEESTSVRRTSGAIALDAMFSPVRRVRFNVENTRVGQKTDLDKLVMTVDTDGSLTPAEAFEEAAAILVNQYTALAGSTTVEAAELDEYAAHSGPSLEFEQSIDTLNLSQRTINALMAGGIETVGELVNAYNGGKLSEIKGFGKTGFEEVSFAIAEKEF